MLIKTFYPQEIVKGEYVFPIFTDKVRGRDQATNDLSKHVQDVTTTNQSKRHREVPRGHQCLKGSDTDRDDWRTSKLAEASVLVPKATTDTDRSCKSELVTQPPTSSCDDVKGPWNRQWVSINSSDFHPRPGDDH